MPVFRLLGLERTLLTLFVLSGFAGLIYQAIWSHYLGLSLGHAAYAQTLVLAIFMGGMALGAWVVSVWGVTWRRLILAYAVVEILIGLAGLFFHAAFVHYTELSQQVVYPALESAAAVRTWQWGSAALIILPQCVLLGMTFPLMSGGYLRLAPRADGEILGGLYFSNSIGAAFGALFATFLLLPMVGMPGTVATAGAINIVVGLLAWWVSGHADMRGAPEAGSAAVPAPQREASKPMDMPRGFYALMLAAACITGASSFVYEIGWVRMLNQVLGTTVHSFELMLSAFILGLAFGGYWIRRRSQRIQDPVAYAGYAQIWMGVAALASLPIFAQSFYWVSGLMSVLPKDDTGYNLFMLASAGLSMLVMFPAAFFAGMTLPLFTMALLRRGAGEASIGRVYAVNTLGAIIGVALAVHVLIPLLGLKLAVTLAAVADIALGLVLLQKFSVKVSMPALRGAMAVSLCFLLLSLFFGQASPKAAASGVFRYGRATLADDAHVHFLRDGKTATITVFSESTVGTIATNGKPDASLQASLDLPPVADEVTMLMAAALPLAASENPERVAIIGWGSGMTTHTMLGSDRPVSVESIEIERAVLDGAKLFGKRVERAYSDPRSVVHIDDARTFFSTGHRRFDVIVSEPSNPWVSGVASLFTHQFYRFLKSHLNERGVLSQWIQSYELSDPLLGTMLAALVSEFRYVDVYLSNTTDLLFLASNEPFAEMHYPAEAASALHAELARVGLGDLAGFKLRKVGNQDTIRTITELTGSSPHSDFYPVVSLHAPRDRFKGAFSAFIPSLMGAGMPVLEMTGGRSPVSIREEVRFDGGSQAVIDHWTARDVRSLMLGEPAEWLAGSNPGLVEWIRELRELSSRNLDANAEFEWLGRAAAAADYSLGYLLPEDLQGVWIDPAWIQSDKMTEVQAAVLRAYRSAGLRDASAMRADGARALELLDASAPPTLLDHMLVISILGAVGEGDLKGATAIERGLGRNVPPSNQVYGVSRSFLLAWSDVMQRNSEP